MHFLNVLNPFSTYKIIGKVKKITQDIIFLKYYNKKREIIRKSGISYRFFWRMLGSPKISDVRNLFFYNNIFAYSNRSEKEKIIKYLQDNCSIEIENYLNYANKVIGKEFKIFEKTHLFESKINWHYSFFNKFTWKLQKSEKIELRPKNSEIDVKYVWEFNRHQFLTYLGFAYYYTKNETYAKEFRSLILDWIKNNPPLYGINWYSGLEISIRLISWIFTLYFFKDSQEINNDNFFEEIFKSMFQHAYYLKIFYTRLSFNHTIGDLFGIYLFSKIFKKLKRIKKWEKMFYKKFKKQIILQTRPDGTNIEQSVNYHRFVLEFFSLFYILNPYKLKIEERDLIEKMYDYLLYIIKPNGTFPLIGDNDDGRVLLLTIHKENSFKDLINLGSIIFRREDLKYLSQELLPPSILLLGTAGYKIYKNLKIIKPNLNIKSFNNAGYHIIRNNWSNKANYLFVDFGRFGAQHAGHSHSSITNIIYSYDGKDIIVDLGTYTYNKSWEARNLYRSSKAHNILIIDQKNQAILYDWFSWVNKPKIKRTLELSNNDIKLICIHDGYRGFFVKREITTKTDLNNLIIKDSVIRNIFDIDLHEIDINFHITKGLDIKKENNQIIINNKLIFEVFSDDDYNIDIKKSFFSPKYGLIYENHLINIHLNTLFEKKKIIEITTKIKSL